MSEPLIDWPLLGRLSRGHRKFRGLDVRGAGKQIGVSGSTVSRLERGHALSADDLVRFCRWLNTAVETVLLEQAHDA